MIPNRRPRWLAVASLAMAVAAAGCRLGAGASAGAWTPAERATIASLRLSELGPPPADPSNRVAGDAGAAALGRALFEDAGLSATGSVSCATCHRAERKFSDDVARSRGLGVTRRNAPTVVGAAWSPWQFWDGRRDSLWAQALGPLESPGEHGVTRTQVVRRVVDAHREAYESVFGPVPARLEHGRIPDAASPLGSPEQRDAWEAMRAEDRHAVDEMFSNVGKAIAAHERTLRLLPSRFDEWADALVSGHPPAPEATLTRDEVAGLRLFIGRGRCIQCHFGPLMTSNEFHNTGVPAAPGEGLEPGRAEGVIELLEDPFNCLGPWSDATPEQCAELRFVKTAGLELEGAVKVPTLRNVADTAPYMHDGGMPDLRTVLEHYSRAPQPLVGHSDLVPLDLSDAELQQLEAFLRTLGSDIAVGDEPLGRSAALRLRVAPSFAGVLR